MRAYFHKSNWVPILLLAVAIGVPAQNSAPEATPGVPLCTSSDIANMNVLNCKCPSNFPAPPKACNGHPQHCTQTCKGGSVISLDELNTCGAGCIDANNECNACYIWFSSLCGCIQELQAKKPTSCIPSGNITPNQRSPPVWMVNAGHDLITTTYLVPGILQLDEIPNYWVGFNLGQDTVRQLYHGDGTLAINSVASRTEEQIHIHLCNNPNSKVRGVLDGLNRDNYKTLASVDLSKINPNFAMECRVSSQRGEDINQGKDIIDYLGSLKFDDCARYHVGSGYMVDKNGFAWSCITTAGSAQEIFC